MQSSQHTWAEFVLRISVAFAFLYPAINAWFNPFSWLGYFPEFMLGIIPDMWLLHGFGALEIVLALWLLSGKKIVIPASVCTVMLLSIVCIDWQGFEVLFRDVSIAGASFALVLLHFRKELTQGNS